MSAGDTSTTNDSSTAKTVEERLSDLEEEVEDATERSKASFQMAQRALDIANEAAQKVDDEEGAYEEEIEGLRDELDELRDRTDIFKHVQNAGGMDPETRAAICIQKCYNTAQADPNNRGTLTAAEAWKMLDATQIDRTRYYDIFQKAEDLVGDDDVCWYQNEDRGHDPPSRLIVDLDDGRLPSQINGIRMNRTEGDR